MKNRALQYAWELSTKVTGSTTACLVSLTNEDKLDTLNLGVCEMSIENFLKISIFFCYL